MNKNYNYNYCGVDDVNRFVDVDEDDVDDYDFI